MAQNLSPTVVEFPGGRAIEAGTRQLALRPDGGLQNLDEWTPAVAEAIARHEGITLTDEHWQVIRAMRGYYEAFHLSPVRKLLKRMLRSQGAAGLADDGILDTLFPRGVLTQAAHIAGVPVPHLDVELERESYGRSTVLRGNGNPTVPTLDFEGQPIRLTPSGNLLEPHRWNERLASVLAEREGLKLTAEHWEVLNYLRWFYFEYGITPMVKILMKYLGEEYGLAKAGRERLYVLFPRGPSRQGSRIAGLPEPQGCIDG
jgi:tRNA 2-thiouridine synthesizing protein E